MKTITNNTLNKLLHYLGECDSYVFLDTSKPDERNRTSLLFANPLKRIQYFEGEDEEEFLGTVQHLQRAGNYIAGWFSYEFGYHFEPGLKNLLQRDADKGALLADLGVFDKCYTFDHVTGESDFPLHNVKGGVLDEYQINNLQVSQEQQQYIEALGKILDYISAGDTYQVNYTLKLLFDFSGSPEKLYADLRRNQSVSYGAFIRWKDKRVMSFSPELFFWKRDTEVTVRPMKGTLKRGRTVKEDAENRTFLKTDIKNQSENVMIVDLLRNDLGRLMHHLEDGDVRVDSLFDVETYETLLQMTSTITGRTRPDALADVYLYSFFKTIFPCGSVTGAPKIRTMEIINELEKERRGVYTGAIGYMSPTGEAVFNVPIRTVVLDGARGEMGIGSGIVHDSIPEKEWQECLLKGHFLTAPQQSFCLIETILWLPQRGYWLLDEHLQRLQSTAGYFLFFCNIEKIGQKLRDLQKDFHHSPMRVRMTLEKDGLFNIEACECLEPHSLLLPKEARSDISGLLEIDFSKEQCDTGSAWLYHKTSNREVYNLEYERARSQGLFDVIFTNQEGYITEGCITNIIILEKGRYYTPPVEDGLLGGVMRSYLLESCSPDIKEKSLTMEDVLSAEGVFLCNSVRGVVQVVPRS